MSQFSCLNFLAMTEHEKRILKNCIAALVLFFIIFWVVFLALGLPSVRNRCENGNLCDYSSFFRDIVIYSNAFFVDGACLIFFPLLMMIGRTGVFDVLFYGCYRFVESWRRDKVKRDDSAYDYKLRKQEERSRNKLILWPYFAVGALSLLIGGILAIVFPYV